MSGSLPKFRLTHPFPFAKFAMTHPLVKWKYVKKTKTKDILINDHDIDLDLGTLTTKTHLNVLAELLEISREFFHKESHHTSSAEALWA